MRFKLWGAAAVCLLLLGGCDTLNAYFNYGTQTPVVVPSQTGSAPPATQDPNATLAPGEYRILPTNACLVATYPSLRSNSTQTGLLAWKPNSKALAFVAPFSDQLWFSGILSETSGQDFSTLTILSKDILVTGNLLWSPDGTTLAFVAYRQADAVYTVMFVKDNSNPTDCFPDQAAVTDKYSSPKKILNWTNDNHLQVAITCDVDCEQQVDVNILDGTITKSDQPVRKGTLIPAAIATNDRAYDSASFPVMADPAWSPDGSQVVYMNDTGAPWVLSVKARTQFPLNVNGAEVMEIKWSPDGKMLAVRTDSNVEIFKLDCNPG